MVTLALTLFALQTKVRIIGTSLYPKRVAGCAPASLLTRFHPHLPYCLVGLSSLLSNWAREPQLEIGGTEERDTYSYGILPTGSC